MPAGARWDGVRAAGGCRGTRELGRLRGGRSGVAEVTRGRGDSGRGVGVAFVLTGQFDGMGLR